MTADADSPPPSAPAFFVAAPSLTSQTDTKHTGTATSFSPRPVYKPHPFTRSEPGSLLCGICGSVWWLAHPEAKDVLDHPIVGRDYLG